MTIRAGNAAIVNLQPEQDISSLITDEVTIVVNVGAIVENVTLKLGTIN